MGKSSTKAKNKYNAKAYDRISVSVKKGIKDEWKSVAEKQGLSLNAFIENAVNQMLSVDDNEFTECCDNTDLLNESENLKNTMDISDNENEHYDADLDINTYSEKDLLLETIILSSDYLQKFLSIYAELITINERFNIPTPYSDILKELFYDSKLSQEEFLSGKRILNGKISIDDVVDNSYLYGHCRDKYIGYRNNLKEFEEKYIELYKEDDNE